MIKCILRAFTLIEMMVTISLVAILATMVILNINKLKPPEELVDQTVTLISGVISQVIAESLPTFSSTSTTKYLCSAKSSSSGAVCDLILSVSSGSWTNINNNLFSDKVTVQVQNTDKTRLIAQVEYNNGLIKSISYFGGGTDTINTTTEANVRPIYITVQSRGTSPSACKVIELWPNNLLVVTDYCP